MHYPWWYVPFLTSPMLIAIVSVVHVVVSHYAVGGGLFLALETRFAYRSRNTAYLAYLREHAWFFILITVVFGAITGVGIWWTIGLASPLATQTLIRIFVFGWAMEYCFFVLEIVSAFVFFYYWGRLDPKTHVRIGWIYAGSAWISLVLITGITAFMLNSGRWPEHRTFWVAFLNPQLVPQVLTRTGGAFLLASLYVYLHAAFKATDADLRNLIAARSARPALLGSILIVLGGIGWYAFLPQSAGAALAAAGVLNVLTAVIFGLTVAVFVMLYLGPYRNPGWLSPGFAILFFGCGLAAVGTGEFIREAVRKPYIVYNVVLGNQALTEETPQLRRTGYLESGVWTHAYVRSNYPGLVAPSLGTLVAQAHRRAFPDRPLPKAVVEWSKERGMIYEWDMLDLPRPERVKLGRVLFMHHCNDCHAAETGYSAVANLTRGWAEDMIRDVVRHPEQARFFMPPWAGTPQEAELLSEYLISIAPPYPSGMNSGEGE
jgi:cytochrome d ubiquinol oxidase subunit I